MATTTHQYPVSVLWTGARTGQGEAAFLRSGVSIPLAVPPEFGGEGGGSNPEELLTGAVAACYSITFGIIAANRKLPVVSLQVAATGEVEQSGATNSFKKIVVRPEIVVSAHSTDEQMTLAGEMAHKADQYCIVTNAVRGKVEVTIEPNVIRET